MRTEKALNPLIFVLTSVVVCLSISGSSSNQPTSQVTVSNSIYLPFIAKPYPTVQLHGYVTENSIPVAGVRVDLLYNAQDVCDLIGGYPGNLFRTTLTDANGLYNFRDVPTLIQQGILIPPCYATVYTNPESNAQRLASWMNTSINTYTLGSTVNVGDFDVADVMRIAPSNGAQFPQYINAQKVTLHFQWTPRPNVPTDSYALVLYEPGGRYGDEFTSGPLGYVGDYVKEFSLCFAACGPSASQLRFNGTYLWRIIVVRQGNWYGEGETSEWSFSLPVR